MKRYGRSLKNFLYLGKKPDTLLGKRVYQITYVVNGHDELEKLVHCVVEIVDGALNGKDCPIILSHKFSQEKEDGSISDMNSFDKKEVTYVDNTIKRMFIKEKINFD